MPTDPVATAQALADVGGWAAFLASWIVIGVGLYRKWWVLGIFYAPLEAEVKALREAVLNLSVRLARERGKRGDDA